LKLCPNTRIVASLAMPVGHAGLIQGRLNKKIVIKEMAEEL
jgi:hypothetical protein